MQTRTRLMVFVNMVVGVSLALVLGCSGSEAVDDPASEPVDDSAGAVTAQGPPVEAAQQYQYESLDLATAESAAQLLIDAYNGQDFVTVFRVADKWGQAAIATAILFGADGGFSQPALPLWFPELAESQYNARVFDAGMRLAVLNDILRLDLTGAQIAETQRGAPTDQGADTMHVVARVPGGSDLILRMVQTSSGRWRVRQLGVGIAPSDDESDFFQYEPTGCQPYSVEILDGAQCPSEDRPGAETLNARLDQLDRDGADIDPSSDEARALVAEISSLAQALNDLPPSDSTICAVMQGRRFGGIEFSNDVEARGIQLVQDVCPGELITLREPLAAIGRLDISLVGDSFLGSLDLSSPERAAAVAVSAFDDRDFFRLALLFDEQGEENLGRSLLDSVRDMKSGFSMNNSEHGDMAPHAFELLMEFAVPVDGLIVDLAGGEVGETTKVEGEADDQQVAVVSIVAPAHDEAIAATFTLSESGRWRLRQLATPESARGGNAVFRNDDG